MPVSVSLNKKMEFSDIIYLELGNIMQIFKEMFVVDELSLVTIKSKKDYSIFCFDRQVKTKKLVKDSDSNE